MCVVGSGVQGCPTVLSQVTCRDIHTSSGEKTVATLRGHFLLSFYFDRVYCELSFTEKGKNYFLKILQSLKKYRNHFTELLWTVDNKVDFLNKF